MVTEVLVVSPQSIVTVPVTVPLIGRLMTSPGLGVTIVSVRSVLVALAVDWLGPTESPTNPRVAINAATATIAMTRDGRPGEICVHFRPVPVCRTIRFGGERYLGGILYRRSVARSEGLEPPTF